MDRKTKKRNVIFKNLSVDNRAELVSRRPYLAEFFIFINLDYRLRVFFFCFCRRYKRSVLINWRLLKKSDANKSVGNRTTLIHNVQNVHRRIWFAWCLSASRARAHECSVFGILITIVDNDISHTDNLGGRFSMRHGITRYGFSMTTV